MGTAAAVVVGVVLMLSGAAKLFAPAWPAQAAELGAPRWAVPVVPWVEVVLGSLLAAGVGRPATAWLAAVLLTVFTVLVAVRLAQGRRPPCACFGRLSTRSIGAGTILRLADANNDGLADANQVAASGLNGPHNLEWYAGSFYVAENDKVSKLTDLNSDGLFTGSGERVTVTTNIPSGGGHSTRTLRIGPDGKLYVAAGSTGNNNVETDKKPWAEATKVILPTFEGGGTHVNLSGVILAKNAPNKANAIKLIEWLVEDKAQQIYADANYEYPVRTGVAVNATIAGYGKLNPDPLQLSKIAENRKAASTLVDKVGFDN